MADGTGKDRERRESIPYEKVVKQRDEAREDRDLFRAALEGLVRLWEALRSVHYAAALERAWEIARQALLK